MRLRTMLSGKIHRATVTGADVNYVDSVTVDHDLLEAADILPGEQVDVVDVTNGARLTTYVIPGERGKGEVKLNGAAAHLVSVGHLVIIMCYSQMDTDRARGFTPKVVFVDADNRILDTATDPGQVPENDLGLYASGIPFDHAH